MAGLKWAREYTLRLVLINQYSQLHCSICPKMDAMNNAYGTLCVWLAKCQPTNYVKQSSEFEVLVVILLGVIIVKSKDQKRDKKAV